MYSNSTFPQINPLRARHTKRIEKITDRDCFCLFMIQGILLFETTHHHTNKPEKFVIFHLKRLAKTKTLAKYKIFKQYCTQTA